jgi:uncharacterized sporulation protein YeaH/YhbH (DUF444 family)
VHVEAEKQILLEEIAVKDAEANQRRQAKHDSANAAGAAAETVEAEIAAPRQLLRCSQRKSQRTMRPVKNRSCWQRE